MTEKLPSGEALKRANKNRSVKRATSKRLNALQKEWVGDSEMTRAQLIARQASMREEMYERHPELRVA